MDLPVYNSGRVRVSRLPSWLSRPVGFSPSVHELKAKIREKSLHTVCEEARCPNLEECWSRGTATFMILGDVCTRHCGFCSVEVGVPREVNPEEPTQVAEMVKVLGLKHAVITCVARDDLDDGGAAHFVEVIRAIRRASPACIVEILTTDFGLKRKSMESVCDARPDIFNHNLETVERLSPRVRHRASYANSLEFLRRIKDYDGTIKTKSGLMLGLGETKEEVIQAMDDLRESGCEILTIGQYLQPTKRNLPVVSFIHPDTFKDYEEIGNRLGFSSVASGPLIRSSYHAEKMIYGI